MSISNTVKFIGDNIVIPTAYVATCVSFAFGLIALDSLDSNSLQEALVLTGL